MDTHRLENDARRLPLAGIALLALLLLQGTGLALTTLREGTPIGSWLFLILRWPEAQSIALERFGTIAAIAAALVAFVAPRLSLRIVAGVLASGWCAALAIAEWRMGGAPFTDWALLAHATRIALPLLAITWRSERATKWVIRVAVALTFAVHGVEAFRLHPGFTDYLLIADMKFLKSGMTQGTAEMLLRVIGIVDLVVAALILAGRDHRPVLLWAAFWGFVSAGSRMVQGGEDASHHTLIRIANGGLPLLLFLLTPKEKARMSWKHETGRLARVALPMLLLVLPALAGAQTLNGGEPGHLRVVWTEDPAHRATISWSTTAAGSSHEVYFDTQPRSGNLSAYAHKLAAKDNGTYQSGGPSYHHAHLTGLSPATKYHFVVVSDGRVSAERHFISAHEDDRAFRLLFGGDSRTGVSDRRKMNQLIAKLTEEDPGVVALAHGGDYIDSSTNWSEWSSWLEDHALTFTSGARVLPIIPTRGNHEGDGVLYNRVFGFPGGTSVDYFVTKLGRNTTFITLDSNVSHGGTQQTWLEAQLKAAQDGRWVIPSYHRPAFPANKTPGSARQFWVPLFEKYNVDVVCESDGHVLKRTLPIRNEKHDPTGIVYIGEGGLGVPQRTPIKAWYLESPGMARSAHHVQVFSVSPEELVYEARAMSGAVEDRYVFKPRRHPAPVEEPPVAVEPQPEAISLATVAAPSATQVDVTFSVDMDASTTGTPAAYAIDNGVSVTDVAPVDARTFRLSTTPLPASTTHTLTVSGVTSAAGATVAEPLVGAFLSPTADGTPAAPLEPLPVSPTEPSPGEVTPSEPSIAPETPATGGGCSAGSGPLLWSAFGLIALALGRRRSARGK